MRTTNSTRDSELADSGFSFFEARSRPRIHGGKIHQRGGGTERGAEQNILPQRGEQSVAAQHDAGQHDLCGERRQNEPLQTAGR